MAALPLGGAPSTYEASIPTMAFLRFSPGRFYESNHDLIVSSLFCIGSVDPASHADRFRNLPTEQPAGEPNALNQC